MRPALAPHLSCEIRVFEVHLFFLRHYWPFLWVHSYSLEMTFLIPMASL